MYFSFVNTQDGAIPPTASKGKRPSHIVQNNLAGVCQYICALLSENCVTYDTQEDVSQTSSDLS